MIEWWRKHSMLTCEICGRECYSTKEISLEGAVLQACNRCAELGKPVSRSKPPRSKLSSIPDPRSASQSRSSSSGRYPPVRSRPYQRELVPVEDFTKLIRTAREQKGMAQKEVARQLHERTSVIAKVESGKMAPTISLAQKLERLFKLTLLEEAESVDLSPGSSHSSATLGDVVQIKRKKSSS